MLNIVFVNDACGSVIFKPCTTQALADATQDATGSPDTPGMFQGNPFVSMG